MRYKEFNPNRVLEKCIILFWKNGFEACSINDIVKATNVNRFSLYEEFENKDGILLAALDLYKKRYSYEKMKTLSMDKSVIDNLKEFYHDYFKESEHHGPGCFIIHISTEVADSNEDVKRFLDDYMIELESALVDLLARNTSLNHSQFLARQLLGLFCTAMSFCLIHTEKQRINYINNGIELIFNHRYHAQKA